MSAPNTPADFKALISDPTSTMCGNFINTLLKLPVLLFKLVNYLFDASGNPTKAFVNQALKTGSLVFSACTQTEDGTILLCDGREVSQTTYADLYAKIGATYGTASAGNFKLPDYRGRSPIGIGTSTDANGNTFTASLGTADGEAKHKLVGTEQGKLSAVASFIGCSGGGTQVIDAVSIGGTVLNNGSPGPSLCPLQDAGTAHNNIQPILPCYIYIVC